MNRRDLSAAPQDDEALVVGTWFARIGAAALLVGAAFGFKYAVDEGWIGPAARVGIGVAAGLAFVAAAEAARTRTWPRLAQALAGGGAGLLYLSFWAAFALYGLIPAWVAFTALAAVAVGATALAVRHDSEALALLSLAGGFLNPYVTGLGLATTALLAYVLILDMAVLALAYFRRWRAMEAAAMAGTWLVAFGTVGTFTAAPVVAFAAAYFAVFEAQVLVHALVRTRPTEDVDLALLGANGSAFFAVAAFSLDQLELAAVSVALGAIHLALGTAVRTLQPEERRLQLWLLAAGVVFVTIAVPIGVDGPSVGALWAIEGAALVWMGSAARLHRSIAAGLALLGLSIASSLAVDYQLGTAYRPERLLFSVEGMTFLIQIVSLAAVAWLLRRDGTPAWTDGWSRIAGVAANVLALTWFTLEAVAAFGHPNRFVDPRDFAQLQFAIAAIWSLYATALLSVGVAVRSRRSRLFAVALFGVVLLKLCVFDLWLIEPLHRTISFIGLGLLLLLGSFMYHRFHDLVVEDR